jgi:uncharacterized membrane protein
VVDEVFATWVSAILICFRMYERSEAVIEKPWPTAAVAVAGAITAAVGIEIARATNAAKSLLVLLIATSVG